jgi:hypothetical protein
VNQITATIHPLKKYLQMMQRAGGENAIINELATYNAKLLNHIEIYKNLIAFLKQIQGKIVELSVTTKDKKLDELNKIIDGMIGVFTKRLETIQNTPAT